MTDLLREVGVSRKGEERLRSGHPWVFGDDLREVPTGLSAGEWAWVRSRSGEPLGTATINLGSRIALRRVSRADVLPTEAFLGNRLREACERRAEAGMGGERALRILYSVCYIADWASLRSLVWFGALSCPTVIIIGAALA